MSKIRSQRSPLSAYAWLLCGLLIPALAWSQDQRHWVGGNGTWNDAAHWSLTANGAGGAGVPRSGDAVTIAPASGQVVVTVNKDAAVGDLVLDGTRASITLAGSQGRMRVGGDLELRGSVAWDYSGTVELVNGKPVSQLDLRGIPLKGDLLFTGGGTWSMRSDLVVNDRSDLQLRSGTLVTNGNMLRAGKLAVGDRGAKLMAGSSVVFLVREYAPGRNREAVDPGTSRLLIGGAPAEWIEGSTADDALRAMNVCATAVGQTPFTIDAQLMSNYNGFGVSCHRVCNGSVRVVVVGGVGPFTYSWVGGPTTATWNNVCPGNQIVIVTDQGQGVSCATTVQVTDPALLSVIFTGTQPPTCHGVCNGSSTVFAVGGVPGYNYSWNNGAGTGASFNQLCPGSNTLHVTDANGCAIDTTFVFPVQPIQPNLTTTDVLCANACDGTATVAPVGGTGSFTYNWGPGNPAGDGTPSVTGLCAGNYTVNIRDANGCDTTLQFVIDQPAPIIPNATHVDASCGGICDGTASVAPTGGGGLYGYSWSPAPGGGQSTANATGLCEGTYTVTIVDLDSGCDTVVSITIDAPPALIPNPGSTDATCANSCDGTATVAPAGGTPPYAYLWSPAPPAGQGTNTAAQLCPGNWSVTITDGGGCDTTVQFTIEAPLPISPNASQTNVSCAGDCDGTATAPATGGTGTLSYAWGPSSPAGDGSPTATGLCAGTWTVTISDDNGCDTTLQFIITEPDPLTLAASQTDVTCGNACDGTATATVDGGTPGYTYVWAPEPGSGQGTATAGGLCDGVWTVTITDANGCEIVQAFNILPAVPLEAVFQLTPASCPGTCDGEAEVVVNGGTPGYTYLWNPAPATGQGTASVTGLCEGPGSLTVTDAVGCDTTITFTITAPDLIEAHANVTDPTCAGSCDGSIVLATTGGNGSYTYVWTPVPGNGNGTAQATGLCAGDYQVLVTSGVCDTTFTFTLNEPPAIDVSLAITAANCANACDGTATLTGDLTDLTFTWAPAPGAGQGTATATGLCAGNYAVTVTNAAGCDTLIAFTIDAPTPIVPALQITDASCGTDCDGSVAITTTGGTPVYTYFWAPAPGTGQGTSTAGGLCPGDYAVTITDAAGCDTTVQFAITRPPGITAAGTVTPASCTNVCDGAIDVTATGGLAPYTWTWTPEPGSGQGTASVTSLCPGTWNVTIGDQAGCDTTLIFTVTAPPVIEANATVTDPTCAGSCDGSIVLAATGGNGTFTYAWSPIPPNGNGTAQATGLCAGDYLVRVSSGGCDSLYSFTLTQPLPIDVALAFTAATCSNDCDGTATLTGDLTGLTFTWTPAPGAGQGTATATGLCAGSYSVRVANAAGCDTLIAFTIDAPTSIVAALDITNASCGTACNGSAVLAVSGGTPGYTYVWAPEPGTGQGTSTAGDLCPDTYTVTITDAAGCDTTVQFTISRPGGIIAAGTITPASCANVCDGTIGVSAIGGVGAFTYVWTPEPGSGQGTASVADLCPGTWSVTIGDAAGCDTTLVFVVGSPDPIDPQGVFTNESCNGPCDGTATVSPVGGNGVFTYAWSPAPPVGAGTASVSGLCAGDWCVTITDGTGCDTTWCFTILPTSPIEATITSVDGLCWDGCTAEATVVATGGAGGYSYVWAPAPVTGQGTGTAGGLCEGPGTVTITDAAGCDTTLAFTISNASPIQPNLTILPENCTATCTGEASVAPVGGAGVYGYLWAPEPATGQGTNAVTGLCAGVNYTVTITDMNGCDSIVPFTVPAFVPIEPTIALTMATCSNSCEGTATITATTGGSAPYSYFWTPTPANGQGLSTATGLCAGSYQVLVSDANGCDTLLEFSITAPLPIDPNAAITDISCAGPCDGAIDLDTQGGTPGFTYVWTPAPPVGQGTANVSQLCAGNWSVLITDASGCDTTVTYTLAEPTPIVASVDVTQSHCGSCDGAAQLHAAGGSAPYSFFWGAPLNVTTADSLLTDLCAGVYTVTITDASGCSVPLAVAVSDSDGEVLNITDGITSCPDVCDGSVSVSYNCSVAPCTVAWTDMLGNSIGTGTDMLDDLCAGMYLVSLTNGSGCITVDTARVTEPAPLVANISSSPTSCVNTCDGIATIGIVGGVGPFSYSWSPAPGGGQGTPQATGLCAGSYDVFVQDQGGCDATYSVLILSPDPINVAAVATDISCVGQCDGEIALNAQGGNGPFTYTWSPLPPAGQGTATVSGLCSGTWSVTVADANGCDTTVSFTLIDPLPLTLAATTTESHCVVCDGTATLVVTGGTAPADVQWTSNGNPAGSGDMLTDLCAGIYVANVTDAHGCTATQTVVVPDANGETITAVDGQTLCANACDGAVSVTYNCTDAPCVVSWYDMGGNLLAQGQDTLSGLCTGSYLVQVLNGSGCATVDTAQVVPSQVIVPNLSTSPVRCYDRCDGIATVGPTGGTAPYTFNWVPAPGGGQGTPQATGLCPGSYQVTITDASGCDIVASVLITAPAPLSVSATVEEVTCSSACDGSIVLAPTGGNGFYSYVWSPMPPNGPGSNAAFNLCPGEWSVTIADLNGCDTTITYTISEPDPLSAATSSTLSTCSICNGTASVVPAGGTAPYAITWLQNGAALGSGTTIIDLCAGLYTVRVVDAHGCEVELPVPVSDLGGEVLSTTDFMLTCPDQCDGVVSVSFNCDEPPCTAAWFDAAGNDLNEAGNTLSNLCAGTYFVQVTNGLGCTSLDTASVNAPDAIVANLSTTPVTCPTTCDGTATVGPTGGAGDYTYSWDLGTGTPETTPQVTGLCVGSYQVTITDVDGCSIIQDALILAPPPITAMAVVVPVTCNGACDGAITLMGQGGTGTLSYSWSPEPGTGQGTHAVTGLCADDWSVTITDANGCDTTFTLTLTDPPLLTVGLTHTDNVCFTDCVATAHTDIAGGVPPYAITWATDNGTVVDLNVVDVFGLCGGNYTLTVADSRGCEIVTPFTIDAGDPIEANLSFLGESCNGPCDGSASVAPTGGTGAGFSYLWAPGNPNGQGTDQVTDLCPGNWTVTITDGAGCDTTYAFTIDPFAPILPVATMQQVTCNGDCNGSIDLATTGGVGTLTYQWTPDPDNGQGTSSVSGLCPGNWTVLITDVAGCDTSITYSITEPPVLVVTEDAVIAASCNTASDGSIAVTISGGMPGYDVAWAGPNGFTSTDEDISGLLPGSYVLTVTDQNNCQVITMVMVAALNTVVADAGGDRTECSGVLITVDGSASQGATTYAWFDDQGNSIGTDAVINVGNLPDGVYTYVLNVADGVCTDADTLVITVLPTPIADAGLARSIYLQGTTVLGGAPAGPPGSTFIWQPDSLLDHNDIANPTATLSTTTWFHLTVIGPDGCASIDSVLVTVVPEVKVPSGFTPNGDGHNDTWVLDIASLFPNIEVQVFSRWGEPLFRSVGYAVPWDGKYDGKVVPMGTYYYVVELHDDRFPEALTGPLTVIR